MSNQHTEIDLVYLWVDGSDPQWLARKNRFLGVENTPSEADCKGRFANNNELKYSLRSVEKHLPWIRKIFIVTDNQTPDWLDTEHPKIEIIDHRDILPPEALPCYNSVVIEQFLYRIPDLSERFLYANDDMFANADLSPDFFYAPDGFPYVRLLREFFDKWINRLKRLFNARINIYRKTIGYSSDLIKNKFGKRYLGTPHHNIDAYKKTDYKAVIEEAYKQEIFSAATHHVRNEWDIQRVIFSYYALAIGHGHKKYVNRKEACRIRVQKPDFMKYIERYQPKLFCLNDTQHVTEKDRERIVPFLEALFPAKSAFEK